MTPRTSRVPAPDAVGLFGKIPAQGDFVRINAADPAVAAFDQWMQEALEAMTRAGATLPVQRVYFVFRPASGTDALVGAFAPSVDRVGRAFPLAVFVRIDAGALAPAFPAIPTSLDGFLQEASRLLAEAPHLDLARLGARLRGLRLPGAGEVAQVDAACRRTLEHTYAADVQHQLFGEAGGQPACYAFKTFLDACDTVRGRPPARTAITLDCPIGSDVDLYTWLELARRRLQWTGAVPSFFWSEEAGRLLLALGTPPAALLRYLARPDDGAAQLWPLLSQRPDALAQAMQALAAPYRAALGAPDATLETLLANLSR